jgi:2-succinyl-6-hydroxy-2,4-cyclohexadiene-1-carboxylate synthase
MVPRDDATPGPLHAVSTGAGTRLALVHGFTQTGRSWRPLAELLGERHEVVTVDLPYHGRSAATAVGSLEAAAAALGATCGRSVYVGYSLGGRVCLTLALAEPERVERLVLVSASPGLATAEERSARRAADEALAARLEAGGLEPFLEAWLAGPLFAHLDDGAADLASRRENDPAALASALRVLGTGSQPSWWDRLGELEMPVLVCAGRLDAKFVAIGERMAAAIGPNATLSVVEGAGHAVPFEQPAAFAALVEAFAAAP